MDEALMAIGKAPGGAFTDEQMNKYRREKIWKLAELIPEGLTGIDLAEWLYNHSKKVVDLIKYGQHDTDSRKG